MSVSKQKKIKNFCKKKKQKNFYMPGGHTRGFEKIEILSPGYKVSLTAILRCQ